MRRWSQRRGVVLALTAVAVATAAVATNGAAGASSRSEPRTQLADTRPGARAQPIYEQMNRLAEELRLEVNDTTPDRATIRALKAELRSLADRL